MKSKFTSAFVNNLFSLTLQIDLIHCSDAVFSLALSKDNNTLAVGFSDRSIRYFDVAAVQDSKKITQKLPRKKPQLKLEEFLDILNELTIVPQSKIFEKISNPLSHPQKDYCYSR